MCIIVADALDNLTDSFDDDIGPDIPYSNEQWLGPVEEPNLERNINGKPLLINSEIKCALGRATV